MCLEEDRLHSLIMMTILGSIVNIIGGTHLTIELACKSSL